MEGKESPWQSWVVGFLGSYATHDRTCAWVTEEKPGDLHIRLWISWVGIKGTGITLLEGQSTKRSPNLLTLTEAGQGSEEEDPQKESLHDEEGQQPKTVTRSAPT